MCVCFLSTVSNIMEELLESWDLPTLVEVFKNNDITLENILHLTSSMIKELIPSVGKRIKFINKLKIYKSLQGMDMIIEEESPSESIEISDLEAVSRDENDVGRDDGYVMIIPSDNRDTSFSGHEGLQIEISFPDFDLRTLLQISPLGNSVLSFYESNKHLNNRCRCRLVDIIIKHLYNYITKHRLKHDDYNLITAKIMTLFPSERAATYYVPAVPKRQSHVGRPILARGKLVDKCRNILHLCGDTVQYRKRKAAETCENNDDQTSINKKQCVPENMTEIVSWLKYSTDPWSEVVDKWTMSFEYRRASKQNTIEEFLAEWPILKNLRAESLINLDFERLFPNSSAKLFSNWNGFIEKILLFKKAEYPKDIDVFHYLSESSELDLSEGSKVCCQLYSLCYLLPPKGRIRIDNKHWKFSTLECIEGIIVHAKTPGDIEPKIALQKETALLRRQKVQPYLLVEGPDLRDIHNYYIVVDTLKYQFDSALKALDTLFKIFFVFHASYPVQSEHIWTLIQVAIYNIKTDQDKTFPYMMDVFSLFENQITV